MGVLGVVPGQIGLVQAMEVIKLILKIGKPLIGRFLIYSALTTGFDVMTVARNPDCPLCGERPIIKALKGDENGDGCGV
ncbi:MAG: hypothetical protein N2745_11160 [Syntrophorhabdaceae bacterium]|nr:hypothetical protein [Syntrophorhabdaceae bacterium]